MNIISDSCLGAFMQRDYLKQKYNNPFCWCIIEFKSFLYLIKNYDLINFNNISIEYSSYYYNKIKINNGTERYIYPKIIIDNNIELHYIHYHPTTKNDYNDNGELYKKDLISFISELYYNRLKRMNEKPIFVIGTRVISDRIVYKQIEELMNNYNKYPIYIFANSKKQFELKDKNNVHLIKDELTFTLKSQELAEYFYKKINNMN